jgi:hypothetical protein
MPGARHLLVSESVDCQEGHRERARQQQEQGFEIGAAKARLGNPAAGRRKGPENGREMLRRRGQPQGQAALFLGDDFQIGGGALREVGDRLFRLIEWESAAELQHVPGIELGAEIGNTALRDEPAAVDDGHGIAKPLGLLHLVRGVDDAGALVTLLPHHLEKAFPRLRIDRDQIA